MTKMIATVALVVLAVSGVATARAPSNQRVSDAQVQAVIDARLHQMLTQLNADRAR